MALPMYDIIIVGHLAAGSSEYTESGTESGSRNVGDETEDMAREA